MGGGSCTRDSGRAHPMSGVLRGTATRYSSEIGSSASGAEALIGAWKLVSWQLIVDNEEPLNVFGSSPTGYLVLTPEGRSIVITTAESRQGGASDAERAALHKSMVAYCGRYRVEDTDFITLVDVSWNEDWTNTEQRRHFRVDGDTLFIESEPAPSIIFPGTTDFRRIVWERDTPSRMDGRR